MRINDKDNKPIPNGEMPEETEEVYTSQAETLNESEESETDAIDSGHSEYQVPDYKDVSVKHQLSGMYQNWFLDYASYVILERAVPHIEDGLKPVQRRILHETNSIVVNPDIQSLCLP